MNAMAPPEWWIGSSGGSAMRRSSFAPVPIPPEIAEPTDLTEVLGALLAATAWPGTSEHLAEALPHLCGPLDVTGLRTSLANLGYRTRLESTSRRSCAPTNCR